MKMTTNRDMMEMSDNNRMEMSSNMKIIPDIVIIR